MEIRLGCLRSGLVGYMRIILEVVAYTAGQFLMLFVFEYFYADKQRMLCRCGFEET